MFPKISTKFLYEELTWKIILIESSTMGFSETHTSVARGMLFVSLGDI